MPSTRITVSGVPPFIPNEALEHELRRFGKFASGFRTVSLGCRDAKLKHVQSLRRQVFMFLDSPTQTLEVSFRVKHEEGFYMVYASSGSIKCFECGDVGHKRIACPHKQNAARPAAADGGEEVRSEAGGSAVEAPVGGVAASSEAAERPAGGEAGGSGAAGPSVSGSEAVIAGEVEAGAAVKVRQGDVAVRRSGEEAELLQAEEVEEQERAAGCQGDVTDMDCESESDTASIADSVSQGEDLYSLDQISGFLDDTFGKKVNVTDYFPDVGKFIQSVTTLQKVVGLDLLDGKKRYRLKKHVTGLRKELRGSRKGKRMKLSK